ncbi:MAG: DUF4350 domain-containing protein [Armatimonadetes bacterium]|nr:DUF4350 domain-containing protein [Armatimonadota bacterium]
MRIERTMLTLMGVLFVFALIGFAMVMLGKTRNVVDPNSLSSDPGGALALYELLETSGVPVERFFRPPSSSRDDIGLVIIFDIRTYLPMMYEEDVSTAERIEEDFTMAGAVVTLNLDDELPSADDIETVAVSSAFPALSNVRTIGGTGFSVYEQNPITLVESDDGRVYVSADHFDGATRVIVTDGFLFLNRFIGEEDNAELAVALITSLLPEGKIVAFPDYAYGITAADNVFVRLGPSFTSAVLQLLFLFALLVYTLGKRFGYPDAEIPRKPGTGDFVAALGEAFRRGRCTDIVLDTALIRAVRVASRRLSLPSGLTLPERMVRIPGPLGELLLRIYGLKDTKPGLKETSALLKELDRLLEELDRQGRA